MKQKSVVSVAALAAIVCCAVAASAWAHHDKKEGQDFPSSKMIEKLGLSKDQTNQLKVIREKNKGALEAKQKSVKANDEQLGEAMRKDTPDADLKKLFESVQDAKRALAEARFDKMLEVRKILTPEQRQKFKELHGEHHHRTGHSGDE